MYRSGSSSPEAIVLRERSVRVLRRRHWPIARAVLWGLILIVGVVVLLAFLEAIFPCIQVLPAWPPRGFPRICETI
jgi:hypothetical protein